jgi:transposase-like protein
MPFSKEKQAEYLTFYHCPYCGSDNIYQYDSTKEMQRFNECLDCHKRWWEHMKIMRISEEYD